MFELCVSILRRQKAFRLNLNCVLKTAVFERVREYFMRTLAKNRSLDLYSQVGALCLKYHLVALLFGIFWHDACISTGNNYLYYRAKTSGDLNVVCQCGRCGSLCWLYGSSYFKSAVSNSIFGVTTYHF